MRVFDVAVYWCCGVAFRIWVREGGVNPNHRHTPAPTDAHALILISTLTLIERHTALITLW